jgi:hypothetical protein
VTPIPDTDKARYITGFHALNLPDVEGIAADWHFLTTFALSKKPVRVAGVNFPDSSWVFGSFGIRECGSALRSLGRYDVVGLVWAANHARAVLDLVHNSVIVEGVCPHYVMVTELSTSEEANKAISQHLDDFKRRIPFFARHLVEEWEATRM